MPTETKMCVANRKLQLISTSAHVVESTIIQKNVPVTIAHTMLKQDATDITILVDFSDAASTNALVSLSII
jgi:hypothetical protein